MLSLTHDTHNLSLCLFLFSPSPFLSPPIPSGRVLEPVKSKTTQHLVSMTSWVYPATLSLVDSSQVQSRQKEE